MDFISTNNLTRDYSTGIITTALADHFPVYFSFKFNPEPVANPIQTFREFSEDNKLKFKQSIIDYNWEKELQIKTSQEGFTAVNNKINHLFKLAFPIKTRHKNRACNPIKPWMSKGLIISRQRKEKLFVKNVKNHHLPMSTHLGSLISYMENYAIKLKHNISRINLMQQAIT